MIWKHSPSHFLLFCVTLSVVLLLSSVLLYAGSKAQRDDTVGQSVHCFGYLDNYRVLKFDTDRLGPRRMHLNNSCDPRLFLQHHHEVDVFVFLMKCPNNWMDCCRFGTHIIAPLG